MLGKLMRRLFGADDTAPTVAARETYRGYELLAVPQKDANGWRVAGQIRASGDGEERIREFVRADVYPGHDDAAAVTLRKARQIVDEQGESLFRD